MYIKRKTKKGFLDSLQEKNKVKTIGILGSSPGEGVTTMVIAMANYLAEIMAAKTAIVECNDSGVFESMRDAYIGNCESCDSYTIGKVTYYFGMDLNHFFVTYANLYEYVIVDFGSSIKKYCMSCGRIKYKIIMGSIMPYKVFKHEKLLLDEECKNGLHLLFGDDKNVKEYSVKNKINALPAPMIVNPYIIESKLANFFQLLF